MSAKKIFQLAKDHNMSSKAMLRLLNDDLKISVKSHFSTASQEMIDAVGKKLSAMPPVVPPETKPKSEKDNIPEKAAMPEEVIFFSPSKCHDIAYKKETYFANTFKIKEQAKSITFADYEFRTSDPEKIAWIKKCKSFTIRSRPAYPNGKIRIVTEEQLAKLKAEKMPQVESVKSAVGMGGMQSIAG